MEKVEWDESYNIGVEVIDNQHKGLFEILNELNEIRKEKDINKLRITLNKLKDYAKVHFADEEKIMKSVEYPNLLSHLGEHSYFVDQVKKMEKELEDENVYITLSMLVFLKEWLTNHILKKDRELLPYIQKKN